MFLVKERIADMKQPISQWFIPMAIGAIIAFILNPLLALLLPDQAQPYAAVGILPIMIAVAWIVFHHVRPRQRLGWGCVAIGICLLALFTFSAWDAGIADPDAWSGDSGAAAFFFLIIFGIPYIVASLAMIGLGMFLLNRSV